MNTYKLYTVSQVITIKNCESEEHAFKKLEEASNLKKEDVYKIEKVNN